MDPIASNRKRRAGRWLLAALLVLFLFWLALPRLLGVAAERWLEIPGLEALHVDIETIGAGQARLSEVRGVYKSAGGHRFRLVLHDISVDYSPVRRHIERLNISRGELEILSGPASPASPWPKLEWPRLPLSEVQVGDLRVAVTRPEQPRLEAQGSFLLRQTAGQLQAEFRPDADLLRLTASQTQGPGDGFEIAVEWLPAVGPVADAQLYIGRQPTQQPARLVARVPLPVLAQLAGNLGVAVPLNAPRGMAMLNAEAVLGESAGIIRTLSGEAEFAEAGVKATGMASPLDITLAGKVRFAWQPAEAQIELQPGLRWQVTVNEPPMRASGHLAKVFTVRQDAGGAVSEGEFPFKLTSPQAGQWEGAVRRVKLSGGAGFAGWSAADLQLRFKGVLKQWQREALLVNNIQAAGDVAVHWSRPSGVRSELAMQVGVERLSWSGASPLTVAKSTWKVSAEAAGRADGGFWNSLVVKGEASSPQLKVEQGAKPALTLGPSRLQWLTFRPARAAGELVLSSDAVRIGTWPAPDLRARLHLDRSAMRADGTLLLQGTEVVRFAGEHTLAKGCGEATLTTRQTLPTLGKLLQPRPTALAPLDFQAGTADARFSLDWCTGGDSRFDAKGTLQVRDAALGWERARAGGVQATLRLDGLHPVHGRLQLAAQRGELATGTPLADLNIDLALATQALTVHALHVNVLGGRVYSEPLSLSWPPAEQTMPLEIRQIDLGQLLALFEVQGLSGSGQLGGVLPLRFHDGGVEIDDGQLNSLGAGTLKYAPALEISDNPGLQALRNFHFRQLGLHLWYGSDGAYRSQIKLEGNNPDFYSGYPIRFGLNINGALPGLFRAALFSGDFNRHILEQLQSGKLQ